MRQKYKEGMENEFKAVEHSTLQDQLDFVKKDCLSDPGRSHSISVQQKLFNQSKGKVANVPTSSQIKNTMKNFRKDLFLPTTLIDAFRLAQTYTGQPFCPRVTFLNNFSINF